MARWTRDWPRSIRFIRPRAVGPSPQRNQLVSLCQAVDLGRGGCFQTGTLRSSERSHRWSRSRPLGNLCGTLSLRTGHWKACRRRPACGGSDRAWLHDRIHGFGLRSLSRPAIASSFGPESSVAWIRVELATVQRGDQLECDLRGALETRTRQVGPRAFERNGRLIPIRLNLQAAPTSV